MLRLTGGDKKNHALVTPKGGNIVRPALAKVREAIFSSLGNITGMVILDVFAGCGSLGFEGLSRGASFVCFVENHPTAIRCLIQNLQKLGYTDRAVVFKRKMPNLKNVRLPRTPDIVFCDPPYDKNLVAVSLRGLLADKFIDPQTRVIVEHSAREVPVVPGLTSVKEKKFGQTRVSFLRFEIPPHPFPSPRRGEGKG